MAGNRRSKVLVTGFMQKLQRDAESAGEESASDEFDDDKQSDSEDSDNSGSDVNNSAEEEDESQEAIKPRTL